MFKSINVLVVYNASYQHNIIVGALVLLLNGKVEQYKLSHLY